MTTSSEWQKWSDHLAGNQVRIDVSVAELHAAWSAVPGKTIVSEEQISGTSWSYKYCYYEFKMIYTRTTPVTMALKIDRKFKNFAEFLLVRESGASDRRIKHIVGWPQEFSVAYYILSMAGGRVTTSRGASWLSGLSLKPVLLIEPDGALGDDYKKRLVDSLGLIDEQGRLKWLDYNAQGNGVGSLEMIVRFIDSTNVTFLFEREGARGELPKTARAVYPVVAGNSDSVPIYMDVMLGMIAPDQTLRTNYGPVLTLKGPTMIRVFNGFLPPRSLSTEQDPASTMAPGSSMAISPLLAHIGRGNTPVPLTLLGIDTPGSWRLDNGLGKLEAQGKSAVYTPPGNQTPAVQYGTDCITRIPAALKTTLRKPVDVDIVKHVKLLNTLVSHFLIYNTQETHFFRVSQAGDLLKLTLCFDSWGEEETVQPNDIEWTVLLGNGVMTQDGLFKPAANSPSLYTTIQAVHKDPKYMYWAIITLPVPQMKVEEAVKMLNS